MSFRFLLALWSLSDNARNFLGRFAIGKTSSKCLKPPASLLQRASRSHDENNVSRESPDIYAFGII
jgi:hypothetical protein